MGNLPQIDASPRLSIEIPAPAYLRDHLFQGHPVLPAVEAMETLAREVKRAYPDYDVTRISNARFDKFLPIDPGNDHLPALIDLRLSGTGGLHAALMTRTKAPKAAITRTKTHAELIFLQSGPALTPLPLDVAAAPEGVCTLVAANRIYADLVPFGPAFRNIQGTLRLSPDGALAEIKCPALPAPGPPNLIGSPFALDAAFHAACVWAQRYKNIVAFPVGIDERRILMPTKPGNRYFARILPRTMPPDLLGFDIWLLDEAGTLCEMAQGVHMRDVSGGRLAPPAWIKRKDEADALAGLRSLCEAMTIVELDAVAPFAEKTLSLLEKDRFGKMGARRARSFLAARIALKRLFRYGHKEKGRVPAPNIETVCADSAKPCCSHEGFSSPFYCSVSHDHRFAVAVFAPEPVGVDVEVLSDKALKSGRLFLSENEQRLVTQSVLGQREAAVRVWSTKETVAKSSGMNLADAWQRVQISVIGESQSRFSIDGKDTFIAAHASVDDHVFTLFSI